MVIATATTYGQEIIYDWEEDRSAFDNTTDIADEALIYLKYHVQYDYYYENNNLVMFETRHQIVKANNDNAIARSNRIFVPLRDGELYALKARTLTPGGKMVVLDENEIKEIEDEETGSGYKLFAIEGAEVGSEIEYFYTVKSSPKYFGREFFQFSEPVLNASFMLVCPDNLEFAFKSYNELPPVGSSEMEDFQVYGVTADYISPLKKEEFSAYEGSRQRLEFKLAFNQATDRELFQWSDASEILYQRTFMASGADDKAIKDLIKYADIDKKAPLGEQIAKVEHYIKTNFYLNENAPPQADDITFIMENKIGSKMGLTKLMIQAAIALGSKPQLVLTSDRTEVPFDPDFQTYNYLQEYLIYIPEDEKFIAAYTPEYRYGMVPPELTATSGLFIYTEGGDNPIRFKIDQIPAVASAENMDRMDVEVRFNEDLTANNIHLKRSFNGYQAAFIKAIYPLIEEARRQELLKSLVKFLANDADITTLALETTDFDYRQWDQPLVLDSDFESEAFIENAGDIILLKAGELIGPQTELYQENERQTQVQNEFNRAYDRNITIHLPEGYAIENLDDLKFDVKVEQEGRKIYYFESDYRLDGNTLTIMIDEAYEDIYYPTDQFEAFRKVINAAADWNKVTLIMSRK